MDGIYNAPFAEVIALHVAKPYDTHTLLYDVKVEKWKNRLGHGDREPYRTLPGDVVLLLNGKPESVADLQQFGWTWTFASVTNIAEVENDDTYPSTYFKVKAKRRIEVEDGQHKSLYVVFLANITTNRRIWNALCMRQNLNIIQTVLSKNDRDDEVCELCSSQDDTESDIKIRPTASLKLNKSQNEAIVASILRMQCEHKSSVKLIWGPPGTGKTRTLSFMLFTLLKMNVRTLVCAPTNVSITDLASRVIKLMRESFEVEPEKSFRTCPLGDILIFGNKDRLKCGSDIEEIFLDYRVDRLVECFASLTGWKHRISSMICFLEDCVSEHQIYVENELIKAKQSQEDELQKSKESRENEVQKSEPAKKLQIYVENELIKAKQSQEDELQKSKESRENEVQKSEPVALLEFARDRLSHIAVPLRSCLLKFFTHLARSFVGDQIFQYMAQLVSLLDSLETLFFQVKLTSEELENIFSHQGTVDSSQSSVHASQLLYTKTQCLSILKSLQCSLAKLDFPSVMDKTSIMEFCFKNASLIFCTASSSYKLHSVDIEPVKLLVIDEAAQLKECESIIPLQLLGLRHAVLVGDEWQLPATVISKLSDEAGFGRSLFGRLSSLGHSKHLLDMQYRMHPSISHFPNSNFYQKKIINAPNVKDKSYERSYLPGRMFGAYSFINILEGKEEMDDFSHSRRNMVEVAVTVKIVKKLYKEWSVSQEKLSVGVISPYAAQVLAIQEKLKAENHEGFTVTVKSIDGFQGGEKDIIIISTVRSNNGGSIGFLASPQRTNVSLTRARHCLWILGNERTLQNSDSIWHALVHDAKDRQCFFNADEDSDLAKTIVDVKKDLDQLDDLLNGESILFKSARWKVLFSDNFKNSFHKLISTCVKKSVMNLLLKIASGWRPKRRSMDLMCERSLQIVKQFKVEGYYIVCTIDIMKELNYMQVLKVWDILPLEMVQKLLRRLDSIFAMYTVDFINRCKEKCIEGNLEVPKIWPMSHDIVRYKNIINNNILDGDSSGCIVECRSYVENSKVNESLLLMKFYPLSTGVVHHLLSDQDCRELDLPFEVTDEEREIILFPRSSFVLGRSGTGKTTILTMKLYRKIEQHRLALNGISSAESCLSMNNRADEGTCMSEYKDNVLHQLFVTVSPKLCYAIKQHVSRLKSFAGGGQFHRDDSSIDVDGIDQMVQFQDIPDSFVGIKPEKYPLVITLQKFLLMLDGSLGNSYFERFPDLKDFSQDKRSLKSVALQSFMRKKEVDYDHFKSFYWPHFNSKLTKNLEPSRVYTEIMSHIKGGLQVGEACEIKLNREDYVSLSDKRVSNFCAQERKAIYDIFKDYEKMKMELGEFDIADLVIDLHHRLNNSNLPGGKMDFVYVDEVQDLTMRQIALFKYVCKNVDEGFVFSGDTAQTIARGVDFRFEDVRCLFYKEFLMKTKKIECGGRREKGHLSDMFNLCQNFRTHSGVLRLAQSVIDLLCHFFPHTIDVLPPETSFVYGEPPVVMEPGSNENAIITIFGCSGNVGKMVGFGAEQVILVRDDSARKEISNWIGHQALILTIVECKGLEFQDVLLFNFFGSSPLRSQWRVIYEFLKEKDLFDSSFPKSFPSFSQLRHNILCSELKQLYVAITRTKQRLWICENAEELSKPMLDYWKRLGLVNVRKVDDSLAQAMQRASSPEEWKSQGIKLFWEKNYEMAIMCFERAGEPTWEKRAKAAGLRASADHMRGSNPKEARIMLREAAELFYSAGKRDSAAECFFDLEEYERAGRIYLEKSGESELSKAGECFSLAGCYELAADVYAKGDFFVECLSACNKGKCFTIGLQYVEHWKQQASLTDGMMNKFKDLDKIVQEFLESCALDCHKFNDKASLMKFVRAFHTMESRRKFLKSHDCLEDLLVLEEESGNFMQAAEIAQVIGNLLLEVDLLGKAEHFRNATFLTLAYVLSCSLWDSRGKGWPLKSFPQKQELVNKAISFAEKESGSFYGFVCAEVEILLHEQGNVSELIQCFSGSQKHGSLTVEFLSVRKLLDAHFQIHPAKYELEHEFPTNLKKYSEEKILQNKLSPRTLFYLWNLFKDKILGILECLDCLEREDVSKCNRTVDFCLHYFGVRRLSNNLNVTYRLLNPSAEWVKNIDGRFLRRQREVVTLEAQHFVSAFRTYWLGELQSVGLGVLEALYKSYVGKSFSKYCQGICLTFIFDVVKFFTESKLRDFKSVSIKKFIDISINYFDIVFPLDSQESLSEYIIYLRGTEQSQNLLEDVISRHIGTKDELTYGQIGKAVMILLGSGKHKIDLCEMMAKKIPKNSSWKEFLKILKGNKESESNSLIQKFHNALQETYNANWRVRGYIAPNCYLYLMERLVILASHNPVSFFSTKSSFVEWLVYQQSRGIPSASLVTDKRPYPKNVFDFVITVVKQFLFYGQETAQWIRDSSISYKYHPVLVLRLFVILCLLCLNSRMYSNVLFELLSLSNIRAQLPREFCEALQKKRKNDDVNLYAVARAFKSIGDPVVIVTRGEKNDLKFVCPDAIILDMSVSRSEKDIMEVLFPSSSKTSHGQITSVEANMIKSSGELPASISNHGKTSMLPNLNTELEMDRNLSTGNGNDGLQMNWGVLREIYDILKSGENRKDGNLKILAMEKKVQVDILATQMIHFSDKKSLAGEDNNMLGEAVNAIEELKQLSSLITSDLEERETLMIGELLKSLESRRPKLDIYLRRSVVQTDTKEKYQSVVSCDEEISNRNSSEDSTENLPVTVAPETQSKPDQVNDYEGKQGKGKGKNKKGKKSKGRKK
ncbi:uncharacterized protein LOC111393590 [Olea europaea var. sylvestris]|uniref:uncharacterized protein LOC111393590 n=1 Tax=Olea europaea var. sylvestris TaxID=158386 RepID=UPI000C1D84F3|nr:uncharacterized protein LOC111393590 [Olea europaea var. sylvestris]